MIDVSFCGDSMEELRAQMRDFLGDDKVTVKAEKPPAASIVKAAVKTEAKVAETKPAETTPVPADSAPAVNPAYKEIADYIPKAVSKYGRGKIVTLLEGFGAKTGKDLKSEQYVDVLSKLKTDYPL